MDGSLLPQDQVQIPYHDLCGPLRSSLCLPSFTTQPLPVSLCILCPTEGFASQTPISIFPLLFHHIAAVEEDKKLKMCLKFLAWLIEWRVPFIETRKRKSRFNMRSYFWDILVPKCLRDKSQVEIVSIRLERRMWSLGERSAWMIKTKDSSAYNWK